MLCSGLHCREIILVAAWRKEEIFVLTGLVSAPQPSESPLLRAARRRVSWLTVSPASLALGLGANSSQPVK